LSPTIAFGSTHTINPISTSTGFCDEWDTLDWGAAPKNTKKPRNDDRRLACLDDIMTDIELSSVNRDPWENFPALKALMRDRIDWDTGKPMIDIEIDHCHGKGNKECERKDVLKVGPKNVENGEIFNLFNELWKEEGDPLIVKREQLEQSFIYSKVANILNQTWE
jgi:hypothetical protein